VVETEKLGNCMAEALFIALEAARGRVPSSELARAGARSVRQHIVQHLRTRRREFVLRHLTAIQNCIVTESAIDAYLNHAYGK
jgi:hypothetical protein